ncbi:unnamed protein product [Arctogadus glacialis]
MSFIPEASIRETTSRPFVIHMRDAESMQPTYRRGAGVWNQTKSLLYKNVLIKWRTKQQSLQELILPLLLLALLILISILNPHVYYSGISTMELEREDHYFLKGLGYTPVTNVTTHIMEEVAQEMLIQDRLEMFASEEELENASRHEPSGFVGVVFLDTAATSYRLRYPYNQLPLPSDYTESIANCFASSLNCRAANYWYSGFIRLQTLIDATIIQMQTKRSVWTEMNVRVVMMGQPGSVEVQKFSHALISIYLVLTFTPFVTFLIVNVVAEKEQRLKDTMTMMGLYDTAFWLSWGLLYAGLVLIMSVLMALIATYTALFPNSDFFVIFLLIFLYGISSIFFSFLLTPLFKKPKFASTVGSLLTVVFGCLSLFTVLINDFPQPLVWLLCLLSPSAFSLGIAQVVYLEAQGDGAVFSTLTNGPHPLYVPLLMLLLDCGLYLLLAVYLDQVLPGEFRMRRSVLYFLKPSYWSQRKKRYVEVSSVYEAEVNGAPAGQEAIEAVSLEFRGKEAIRIHNIQKVFKEKDSMVNALRGLTFDIYEGQITALLGHSGAGKSALMNILCGISPPSGGAASLYGQPVADLAEGPELKQLVGVCPQFNIIFDVLTVEEHLNIFAAIKGILPADVDAEVKRVLKELDMEKIMDAQARNLSRGQKRKLSVGIAILGDPKILLLDEPTAGMDPCSRHQVWSLLKKRRAGRVTVLSTHYMDEADILADRKAVISRGQLRCVGSSLYLKTKWGVGYHLRMSLGDGCKTESIQEVVQQHVPTATLLRQRDTELTFTLPFESIDAFTGLFSELDSQAHLGVVNYGVSMTTLEDVFLRLEAEAEVDQADYSVFTQDPEEDEGDSGSLDDTDQRLLTFSDGRSSPAAGRALWRQQFSAVAWLHMLSMVRERKAFIYILGMLQVFVLAMVMLSLVTGHIQIHSSDREFRPLYLLKRSQAPRKYATSLLVQNSSDSDISGFIHNLEAQDIKVELMKQNDYMAAAPHSAAINVTGSSKGFAYSLAFNSTTVHSLPMTVNVLSNALLRGLNGTGRIRTWTKPFDYQIPDTMSYVMVYIEAIILGMLAAGMPAYFAMDHTRDREIKCRSTLRISGLMPSAYWCGQAAVDVPLFYLILCSMVTIFFAFHTGNLLSSVNMTCVMVCTVGFGPAIILFTYVVSFGFTRVQSNRDFLSVISMMVCIVTASFVKLLFMNGNQLLTRTLLLLLCLFNPLYPLMACLNIITKATFLPALYKENLLWKNLMVAVIAPYLQCVVLLYLLYWLEHRQAGGAPKTDQFGRFITSLLGPQVHHVSVGPSGSSRLCWALRFITSLCWALRFITSLLGPQVHHVSVLGPSGSSRLCVALRFITSLLGPQVHHISVGPSGSSPLCWALRFIMSLLGPSGSSRLCWALRFIMSLLGPQVHHVSVLALRFITSLCWALRFIMSLLGPQVHHVSVGPSGSSPLCWALRFITSLCWALRFITSLCWALRFIMSLLGPQVHHVSVLALRFITSLLGPQVHHVSVLALRFITSLLGPQVHHVSVLALRFITSLCWALRFIMSLLGPSGSSRLCWALRFITSLLGPQVHHVSVGALRFIMSLLGPQVHHVSVGALRFITSLCWALRFVAPRAERAPEEPQSEDEDVRLERGRVAEALRGPCTEEKPVVVVSNLTKQYKGEGEDPPLSRRGKLAAQNISFCVRKGEVLGLLGPNGAGKSTIMHMLSGDIRPTAGQVLMDDSSSEYRPAGAAQQQVGYCPQVNPLWPRVTLREHLEFYAAVKGLQGYTVPDVIKRVVNALELKDHLDQQTKSLSAGVKRKLCFALSMLGNPQVVLLDEPSAGMDPKSKQRMWRAIRSAFRDRQRGAVITTHYMEEAEAVCDRVAIVVSGQLSPTLTVVTPPTLTVVTPPHPSPTLTVVTPPTLTVVTPKRAQAAVCVRRGCDGEVLQKTPAHWVRGQRSRPTGSEVTAHWVRGHGPLGQRSAGLPAHWVRGHGPLGQRSRPTGSEVTAHWVRGHGPLGQRSRPTGSEVTWTHGPLGQRSRPTGSEVTAHWLNTHYVQTPYRGRPGPAGHPK